MGELGEYASFLVRLWTEPEKNDLDSDPPWQAEVESIQTGKIWQFENASDLSRFFQEHSSSEL